ncbi:MAG: tetratricopeptide repeat protein [Spirochaetota bacterium]
MRKSFLLITLIVILSLLPLFTGNCSFQEAYELYKQEKYYDAEKILLRLKELTPDNLDIYAVLGWCYLNTGRQSKAIDISEEGLERNPKDTRLLTTIGRAYLELKRHKRAIPYLEKSISMDPNYEFNYYYLGRVYLDQEKYILAETALSAAIMLSDKRWYFYKYRGLVYERLSNYNAAEQDYKKALSLKPNDPRLKEDLIRVISMQTEQMQQEMQF